MQKILVTGSSGFIGFSICQRLLSDGCEIIGIDCMNDYYDLDLKHNRQTVLLKNSKFQTINKKIETPGLLLELFKKERPQIVLHLAAQAGVRYSIDNPRAYLNANIKGTFELLEAARAFPPKHMLMASSSSVYGSNIETPYKESDKVDHQVSFYAATKKASENMSHSYSHLYNIPITLLRFFTVYGPWGRPDMAIHKFTKAILENKPINIFNYGNMVRDFTYIDDLVEAIRLLIDIIPTQPVNQEASKYDTISPVAPWRIVNIGNSKPVKINNFINAIEEATNKTAIKNPMPMQAGDVLATWADTTLLENLIGNLPKTLAEDGVKEFVSWYQQYYQNN